VVTGKGDFGSDGVSKFNGQIQNVNARVFNRSKHDHDAHKSEIEYDHKIYLGGNVTVVLGDQVTYNGVNHIVVDMRVQVDVEGSVDHTVLMVKRDI
jgi:hypothetical protein